MRSHSQYLITGITWWQIPCKKFVIEADNESHFIVVAIVLPFFTELSQD